MFGNGFGIGEKKPGPVFFWLRIRFGFRVIRTERLCSQLFAVMQYGFRNFDFDCMY